MKYIVKKQGWRIIMYIASGEIVGRFILQVNFRGCYIFTERGKNRVIIKPIQGKQLQMRYIYYFDVKTKNYRTSSSN